MRNTSEIVMEPWFRVFREVPEPRVRLVCFAHAGGAASVFRSWPDELPGDVEVLAVRYPGRQDRLAEAPVEDMDVLVEAISDALLPLLGRPVAFFGHSMGASVAHEVAVRLEQRHDHRITRLFVSARPAPHRLVPDDAHLLGDDELIEELRRYGDAGADLAAIPEMRELVMPAVRADFTLLARYDRQSSVRPVAAPIDALAGTGDPVVSVADMRCWSELTTAEFTCRAFPGDHFYLQRSQAELLRHVAAQLDPTPLVSRGG